MLMDPTGGIVITNDGNCILREITVQHPAAKSMIEISRTQDEEVGDGTTSVIVLGVYGSLDNRVMEWNQIEIIVLFGTFHSKFSVGDYRISFSRFCSINLNQSSIIVFFYYHLN